MFHGANTTRNGLIQFGKLKIMLRETDSNVNCAIAFIHSSLWPGNMSIWERFHRGERKHTPRTLLLWIRLHGLTGS